MQSDPGRQKKKNIKKKTNKKTNKYQNPLLLILFFLTTSDAEIPDSEKYSIISITSRSTLIKSGSTCWGPMYGQIKLLKIIYIQKGCVKKFLKKQPHKNVNMKYNEGDSLISKYKIALHGLTCRQKQATTLNNDYSIVFVVILKFTPNVYKQ